jgi:hypothetical protein
VPDAVLQYMPRPPCWQPNPCHHAGC